MAALDFPASPTLNQLFVAGNGVTYKWNGTLWVASGGGASISVSDTPPASPAAGAMWWNSLLGAMFIYYNDGNTSQWVPATPTAQNIFERNQISGFTHSNTGGNQSLAINAGQAANSTNAVIISGGPMAKSIAGGWVAGNGNGGMGPGLALTINTWYFPFAAIINGLFDVFLDNSVTPTHIPSGTTAYRRLRPIKTDGSGNILAHSGKGDLVQWNTAIRDINLFNLSSVGTLTQVMSAPPIQTMIQGRLNGNNASGAFYVDIVTPGLTGQNLGVVGVPSGQQAAAFFSVLSDATGALKFVTGGGTTNSIYVDTYGWIDDCGRFD